MLGAFTTDQSTIPATAMERAECPQCDNTIWQEDIIITSPTRGLGGAKRQHVEAHCRTCMHVVVFDRDLIGGVWTRTGKYQLLTEEQHRAELSKRRR